VSVRVCVSNASASRGRLSEHKLRGGVGYGTSNRHTTTTQHNTPRHKTQVATRQARNEARSLSRPPYTMADHEETETEEEMRRRHNKETRVSKYGDVCMGICVCMGMCVVWCVGLGGIG
jgi:hypothetical protein